MDLGLFLSAERMLTYVHMDLCKYVYTYVYVTVSAKTILIGTFSIMRKTDLKY